MSIEPPRRTADDPPRAHALAAATTFARASLRHAEAAATAPHSPEAAMARRLSACFSDLGGLYTQLAEALGPQKGKAP